MRRRYSLAAMLAAILVLGPGCDSLSGLHASRPSTGYPSDIVDRDTQAAVLMADTIQTLQRLRAGSPADQAEIITAARQSYERSAVGGAQLRYALVLATPGSAGRDAEHARQLLRELAARPESLVPVVRALALFELSQLDR